MEVPKPTDEDKAYFRSIFEDRPELDVKPMFGNLAAFVVENQQMCAGLFGPLIGLRLPEADREALMGTKGAGVFGPPERPMKEYVSMPVSWRSGHDSEVDGWIDRAITHTTAMAPKKKRPKKKKP